MPVSLRLKAFTAFWQKNQAWKRLLSRRIYEPTPQRRQVQQEMLLNMRALRGRIDSVLLDRVRETILKTQAGQMATSSPSVVAEDNGSEKVDPARTLSVVKEYMLLKQNNKDVCRSLHALLAKKH